MFHGKFWWFFRKNQGFFLVQPGHIWPHTPGSCKHRIDGWSLQTLHVPHWLYPIVDPYKVVFFSSWTQQVAAFISPITHYGTMVWMALMDTYGTLVTGVYFHQRSHHWGGQHLLEIHASWPWLQIATPALGHPNSPGPIHHRPQRPQRLRSCPCRPRSRNGKEGPMDAMWF